MQFLELVGIHRCRGGGQGQRACWVLGKAMVSRMDSSPARSITGDSPHRQCPAASSICSSTAYALVDAPVAYGPHKTLIFSEQQEALHNAP